MSNVYTDTLNVPPVARNGRIYTGNVSIMNTVVTNNAETIGGITVATVEKMLDRTQKLHGFESATDSVLSFVNGTRTFTITGVDFLVWNLGFVFKMDTESITFANTTGRWYIFYDTDNILIASQTAWDLDEDQPIAFVDWLGGVGIVKDQRRTCFDYNHIPINRARQSNHVIDVFEFTASATPTLSAYNTKYAPTHGQFPRLELIIDNGDGTRYRSMQMPLFTTLTSGGGVADLIDTIYWDLGEPLNGWIIIN